MKTQEEIKTPLRLADELKYVDGEVVTKDVFSNDNGSVRLLAFDKGVMLARHSVDSDVMVYVIEGEVEFEIDDQRHHLISGNSILMPANTAHTVLALDKAKVILIRIR
ncbi:MAG: cupin domain-containing protein [Muribaculaceae bacterium]|nr:cupin domain-containing protein [Muribaculaceae bacterium]MDE6703997.1 cupin domain-containing protein [Muribaculaceae bacterium]